EADAAPTVVLRGTHHLPKTTRRPAGICAQIRRCGSLHNRGDNLAFFEDLVLEEVAAVFAELRMESHSQQTIGPAFVEDVFRQISKQRLGFIGAALFEQPYFPSLMNGNERVARAREWTEPHQAEAHVAGLLHKGVSEAHLFTEE